MDRRTTTVISETVSATTTINAAAETVFAVLADPTSHARIDGTGWVRESLDRERLTEVGQIFRMAMYHDKHPDRSYEMANKVQVFDPPRAIAWKPGQKASDAGDLQFGGWIWRYDLSPVGRSETAVRLSYDWSAVPQFFREHIQFPPFNPDHLVNSLRNLAEIAAPLSPQTNELADK
jgi:hypothetical protein